jgi:hypothetical protein
MRWIAIPIAVALAIATTVLTRAQHGDMVRVAPTSAYSPRLGDLMILQQVRHAKLWFAAAANNWQLAEHEIAVLKEGFADVAKLFPALDEVEVVPMIDALSASELAELDKAIAAQDRVQFVIAYDRLTAACNACHQATKHGFIVIQQPLSPPFNNQSFAPGPADPTGGAHRH